MIDKKSVLILEDHPVYRYGLVEFINSQPDLMVCGEAGSATEALGIIEEAGPDVAVVDLSMEGLTGIDFIKAVKNLGFKIPILVLSMHDESLYAERVISAGASGYIMKLEEPKAIVDAIKTVLAGEIYLSAKLLSRLATRAVGMGGKQVDSPVERLTDRELEILLLIAAGKRTGEIAQKLCLSPKTIGAHRENMKQKLGLKTSSELSIFALDWAKSR